MIISTNLGQEH